MVYTPIHGSGNKLVRSILDKIGVKNVFVVPEQELPDGNFPTVKSPNPENMEAFDIAIEYAKKQNADLVFGTDPDSDRIGVVVKTADGEFKVLNGNQTGMLLCEFILRKMTERGTLTKQHTVVKTIVTTEVVRKIADNYAADVIDVLTGFKFIGEKIKEFEQTSDRKFVFGLEESYGYLKGTYARDKDAVVATMLIAEMTLYYREKGITLSEQMENIYKKYGYYVEYVESVVMEGMDGSAKISGIMDNLRKNTPQSVAGKKVVAVRDYETSVRTEIESGKTEKILLPKSNVIYLELEDGNNFVVRPSGTEPKIKLYCLMRGGNKAEAEALVEAVKADIKNIVK